MTYALFLCNRTENMCRPWLDAGIPCVTVDIQEADRPHPLRTHIAGDVRAFQPEGFPLFVAAFPPCTHLAVSGARWYQGQGAPVPDLVARTGRSLPGKCAKPPVLRT
jgi:hypothetical protein